jgi:hypothetical protein
VHVEGLRVSDARALGGSGPEEQKLRVPCPQKDFLASDVAPFHCLCIL